MSVRLRKILTWWRLRRVPPCPNPYECDMAGGCLASPAGSCRLGGEAKVWVETHQGPH